MTGRSLLLKKLWATKILFRKWPKCYVVRNRKVKTFRMRLFA